MRIRILAPMWVGETAKIVGYAYGFTNVIVDRYGTDLALKREEYEILHD